MKVVRYPECDVLESNMKIVDEFWISTELGPISRGLIFPLSQLDKLIDLRDRANAAKKALSDIEAEIYKISRDFSK